MLARMNRWWMGASLAALLVSSLGVATSWSYVKTIWEGVGETIRDATPIAFDLERLKVMIRDLEPEVRRNQQVVVQLEVEVESLERDVAEMKRMQEAAVAQMKKLREVLQGHVSQVRFGGQDYSRAEVERDLQRRLDRYEEQASQLAAKEQLLEERRRMLAAATDKVTEYRRQYEQLVAKAERLQAELKLLEAAQAAGGLEFDPSRLAQTKQLAQGVEKRIRISQRLVDSQRQPAGEIPVEAETRPAAERFDDLFGATTSAVSLTNLQP